VSEVFFVRHGQASFGSDNYDQLSDLGHQQAEWLGQYFANRDLQFDAIYTGDMVRHQETLSGIKKGLNAQALEIKAPEIKVPEAKVTPQLNEFDFHTLIKAYLVSKGQALPGKDSPRKDFYRILKSALHDWSAGTLTEGTPETWQGFEQRIADCLNDIGQLSGRVLVVSSGGAISMALRHILQSPASIMVDLNLQTKNTGVSHCFFNSQGFSLSSFNHVPHLDSPERHHAVTYS
jgi:broad specificity phosphatase PhoE